MNRGIRYVSFSLHFFTLKRENLCVTLTKIMRSSIPHFSDLYQNCQHELFDFQADEIKIVYCNSQKVC